MGCAQLEIGRGDGWAERELVITPIRQLMPPADITNRRPKEQWWTPLGRTLRLLASYD